MTSRTFNLAGLALAVMASAGAVAKEADSEPGMYLGVALTQARFDSGDFSVNDLDHEDNSWKAIVGVQLSHSFALEANYVNFGKSTAPSVSGGGAYRADADGYALFGVGLMPLGPVDLYLKAGAARIDAKGNAGAVYFKDKATRFAYGAGVQWRMGAVALRAEYEKYDTKVIGDLDLISVGISYKFRQY